MSVPAEKVTNLLQPKLGQVFISGKIDSVRRFDGRAFSRLVMPAPDAYSSPSVIEIESASRFGDPGDEWKGMVMLSGYRNEYKSLDKETGELRTVKSARMTLKLVE